MFSRMANLVRLRVLHSLVNRSSLSSRVKSALVPRRSVGTSGAQKAKSESIAKTEDVACDPGSKYWVSYGFNTTSEYVDRHFLHLVSFVVISIALTTSGYIITYMPDNRYRDWAQREGYLELKRREDAGLPPIDINIIDPAKVKLPDDDIIGPNDIII